MIPVENIFAMGRKVQDRVSEVSVDRIVYLVLVERIVFPEDDPDRHFTPGLRRCRQFRLCEGIITHFFRAGRIGQLLIGRDQSHGMELQLHQVHRMLHAVDQDLLEFFSVGKAGGLLDAGLAMLVHIGFFEILVAISRIAGNDIIPHRVGQDIRTGLEEIACLIALHEILVRHPRFDRDAVQADRVENQKTEQHQCQQTEEHDVELSFGRESFFGIQ